MKIDTTGIHFASTAAYNNLDRFQASYGAFKDHTIRDMTHNIVDHAVKMKVREEQRMHETIITAELFICTPEEFWDCVRKYSR